MKFNTFPLLTVFLSLLVNAACFAEKARPAPACQLSSLDQIQQFDLQRYKGKVLYVDFWASWCGPCVQSFPFMNKLEYELKNKGLAVVAINLDEELSDAKSFIAQHPADFVIATDADHQCAKRFEVKAMPSSYLIDRNGMIRAVHLGFRPGEAEEFRELVEKVLAESPANL